jgi:isoleucyl-tRNA synthetase
MKSEDSREDSVHLRQFPDIPANWRDEQLAEKWSHVRLVRRAILGALEIERVEKRIGSSLQAAPEVYLSDKYKNAIESIDVADLAIVSSINLCSQPAPEGAFYLPDCDEIAVVCKPAVGQKCARCWKVSSEVGKLVPELCNRCANVVENCHLGSA